MQTVLITGASGLLGSSLVNYLMGSGYNVVSQAHTRNADFMFDLSDNRKSHQFLELIQPDFIINLVGLTNVELCEEQVSLAYLVNTRTVENLVNWIKFSGEQCYLVQISTDHVYDGLGLHTEKDVLITNNYALSKYAGELAALQVPSTILRTNFVGRSSVSHRESFSDWVYNSMKCGKKAQVLNDVYFSPLSILKLIEMILLVIQKKLDGIYNLGSHAGMSKADFSFSFANRLKLETNIMTRIESNEALFFKTYRPKNMCMDSSKFESDFHVKLPNLVDVIKQIACEYDEIT